VRIDAFGTSHRLGGVLGTHGVDASAGDRIGHQSDQIGPDRIEDWTRQQVARQLRVDAVPVQHLGTEDVAHPGEDRLIHQGGSDRTPGGLQLPPRPLRVGVGTQRVRPGRVNDLSTLRRIDQPAPLRATQVGGAATGSDSQPKGLRFDGRCI